MGRPLRPVQGHKDLQTPPTGGLKNNMLKTKINLSQTIFHSAEIDFSFGAKKFTTLRKTLNP